MAEKIKLLIVDDIEATRDNIKRILSFQTEIVIAGEADSAEAAMAEINRVQPDIILMDINMSGMDGIAATAEMMSKIPDLAIIIMSVQGEQEYLRQAMVAGAKNYLIKPFSGDELVQAILQTHNNELKRKFFKGIDGNSRQGKIITIFSPKGGIGKTSLTVNLAVALGQQLSARVAIIDANFQFGDVALFFNIEPQFTLIDWVMAINEREIIDSEKFCTHCGDYVCVFPAPLRPEQAEKITIEHIKIIFKKLRQEFDYIIVDTVSQFNDIVLATLDLSDQIIVIAAMDLPTIKNIKTCMKLLISLGYDQDKIKIVHNRINSEFEVNSNEVEKVLAKQFDVTIPNNYKIVINSINKGVPFVLSHPDLPISRSIYQLADLISDRSVKAIGSQSNGGFFEWLRKLF